MTARKAARLGDCISHILVAIGRIEAYVAGLEQNAFERNTLVQDAVICNFAVTGEAAFKIQKLHPHFARDHAELRLDLAYRMRNALIHGYDAVDTITLWNTIKSDLPALKRQLEGLVPLV